MAKTKDETLKTESAFDPGNIYYDATSTDDGSNSSNIRALGAVVEGTNDMSANDKAEIKKDVHQFDTLDNNLLMQSLFHSNNIYTDSEIKNRLYNETFRFGLRNPSQSISTAREYLFFTKPNLNIFNQTDAGNVESTTLQEGLQDIAFWTDLANSRRHTIAMLEDAYHYSGSIDPFNHLLQNMVTSNLDVPELSAETIDTPQNMYGVGYSYRGSSEASDDNQTFSLEFKDTRYLDIYYFFKAYEEYETLKHHGIIAPSMFYTVNKIIHDQFSIYKFIVDEDMETIIYYGKYYGVMPISLPREVFSNPTFDNGITYSVNFKAAFYEDMRPDILSDFNKLSAPIFKAAKYKISPYNVDLDRADMRTAKAAYVVKYDNSAYTYGDKSYNKTYIGNNPAGYGYKLKWKGDYKA